MKKLMIKDQSACMSCLQCEHACSLTFYKAARADLSCIQIVEKNGAVKTNMCVQCGKCARTCPHGAITQNTKGVYMIDRKKCTGCGECVKVCPFSVIVKDENTAYATKCIACGVCAKECPMDILYIQDK